MDNLRTVFDRVRAPLVILLALSVAFAIINHGVLLQHPTGLAAGEIVLDLPDKQATDEDAGGLPFNILA